MPKSQLPPELDKNSFISILMVIVILMWGLNFIYKNRVAEIQTIRNEQTRVDLRNKVSQMQEVYDGNQQKLPEVKETAWLLGEVAKIANQNRIKLQAIRPKPMQQEKDFTKFSIELNIKCTYHELGSFISRLESSKKFIRVDRCDIKISEEAGADESDVVADVQLEVSTFVFNRQSVQL